MTPRSRLFSWIFVAVLMVYLFAPVVLVVLFSFNGTASTSLPFTGPSIRWYQRVFTDQSFIKGIEASFIVAITVGVVSTFLGTTASFAMARSKSAILGLVAWLALIPAILPGLFLGVALLSFYNQIDVPLSLLTVMIGHVLVTLPFVVLIVGSRLSRFDPAVEEAARDLGATGLQAFFKVVFPMVRASVIASFLIVVAASVDEVVIALFTVGATTTLPVTIWGMLRRSIDPSINAVATLILVVTLVSTFVVRRLISPRDLAR
jgi:ABC-type spermidine/putrescine transport system permease subunit II